MPSGAATRPSSVAPNTQVTRRPRAPRHADGALRGRRAGAGRRSPRPRPARPGTTNASAISSGVVQEAFFGVGSVSRSWLQSMRPDDDEVRRHARARGLAREGPERAPPRPPSRPRSSRPSPPGSTANGEVTASTRPKPRSTMPGTTACSDVERRPQVLVEHRRAPRRGPGRRRRSRRPSRRRDAGGRRSGRSAPHRASTTAASRPPRRSARRARHPVVGREARAWSPARRAAPGRGRRARAGRRPRANRWTTARPSGPVAPVTRTTGPLSQLDIGRALAGASACLGLLEAADVGSGGRSCAPSSRGSARLYAFGCITSGIRSTTSTPSARSPSILRGLLVISRTDWTRASASMCAATE